jgi:hypothetical protein
MHKPSNHLPSLPPTVIYPAHFSLYSQNPPLLCPHSGTTIVSDNTPTDQTIRCHKYPSSRITSRSSIPNNFLLLFRFSDLSSSSGLQNGQQPPRTRDDIPSSRRLSGGRNGLSGGNDIGRFLDVSVHLVLPTLFRPRSTGGPQYRSQLVAEGRNNNHKTLLNGGGG